MDGNNISIFVSIIFSIMAITISIYTYQISKREKSYADLDGLYLELLKLGLDYPRFRNPKYTCNYKEQFIDDDLLKYETMAFIAWNICETIYDNDDEILFETWKPVIFAENKLHRKWLDAPENHHKFKERFIEYIQTNFPQEYKVQNTN